MKSRPHILSTRLCPAEVEQYRRVLQAPGGGWYVPADFARWSVLQPDGGASAAIQVDTAAVAAALPRFRTLGRMLNAAAFVMNTGGRPELSHLEAEWPGAAARLLTVTQPLDADLPCPVPVTARAPILARAVPPGFRQKGRPARRRESGETPLRETVVATRLSEQEHLFVHQAADRAGLDLADHFRVRLLGSAPLQRRRLPRPVARVLAAALEECGRQANNVRQIERAHARRSWPAPPFITSTMATLWHLRDTILPTLARWRP